LNQDYLTATQESEDLRRKIQQQAATFEADKKLLEDSLSDFEGAGARALSEVTTIRDEVKKEQQKTQVIRRLILLCTSLTPAS
jgi:hypothetical protein